MKQLEKQISQKEETTSMPKENLLTFNGFSFLKKLFRGLIGLLLIIVLGSIVTALTDFSSIANETMIAKTPEMEKSAYILKVREYSDERLISEVGVYMKSIAPNTKIDPKKLVDLCNKYKIDLTFAIAQGILESHLGTKGLASQTNSVWNVGSHDNGRIYCRYNDPNESIEPYLKLLREKYLIRLTLAGDTIQRDIKNLVYDKGFVNYAGYRFATSPSYESNLRYWIVRVQMDSRIQVYQGIKDLSDKDILSFFAQPLQVKDSLLTKDLAKL